jgi:hypothetical protein
MIVFTKQLTTTLKTIVPETYHEVNPSKKLKYPYLTFTVNTEERGVCEEEVTLELDLFDIGTSAKRILEVSGDIKKGLKYRRDLTDELNLIFVFVRDSDIPTGVENLRRRNLVFIVKVDYRKGNF